jgi:hypothetical protein
MSILRKLIRLALNNSNEAESGRAAIEACKLLVKQDKTILDASKDKYAAPIDTNKETTIQVTEDGRTGDTVIRISRLDLVDNTKIGRLLRELADEVKRPRTWNDVKRSEEPMWRGPFYEGAWTGFDFGESRSERRKRERDFRNQTQANPTPTPEDYAKGAKPYDPENPANYSKTHPKRILKCKTCGNDVETQFVGPPQVFECADCWGKDIKL